MYFNDTNILYYTLFGIIGAIVGQFIDYCTRDFIKGKKLFAKENLAQYQKVFLPNYKLIFITAIFYIALVYKFGSQDVLKLIEYALLTPLLFCIFILDAKEKIIPNRLNLLIFEIGLVFVFIYGITNVSISMDMLSGMLIGGGIFLLIALIGGALAGKEAMGLRRCKINGGFRFIFWIGKYNCNMCNVIFIRCNRKYNFNNDKKK